MPKLSKKTEKNTIDFGFKTVSISDKVNHVKQVFDSVASKYDLMNDVMSFGIHRLWKKYTLEMARISSGMSVLDLAGGTGDFSKSCSKLVGKSGRVVLADINESMVNAGRNRLVDLGISNNVFYSISNAEHLGFANNTFDVVIMAFGLRNVTYKEKALQEIFRVLKVGGMVLILEFSKVDNKFIEKVYDFYSFNILPKIGKIIANDEDSYKYLAESIRMHPNQDKLKEMMLDSGFDKVEYSNLSEGIVALHRGWKF